jgi:ribosome-associated protein
MRLDEQGQSRTARKRAAHAVEDLAYQLVELPDSQWRKLPVDAELREEIALARNTQGHGSRKRQTRHLAALLRERGEVIETVREFLDAIGQQTRQQTESFHELEVLRDRLCAPATFAAALEEAKEQTGIDPEALAGLARSVHTGGDKRAAREIFRRLRAAREKSLLP